MRRGLALSWWIPSAIVALFLAAPAMAQSFYFSPDVPVVLGDTTRLPWQIVRHGAAGDTTILSLPVSAPIAALDRMCDGTWLLVLDAPAELPPGSGAFFTPRDVVRWDGASSFTRFLDGAAAGMPEGTAIDGFLLIRDDPARPVFSFDAPTTIAATTYEPGDLALRTGATFSMYFDASTSPPPLPAGVDVVAVDRRNAGLVFSFDVPVELSGTPMRPGDLVRYESGYFLYHRDPAWPATGAIAAVTSDPAAGRVPSSSLRVSRVPGSGELLLSWSPSPSAGALDYGIYEGATGNWSSHVSVDCRDDGSDRVERIAPGAGNRYYLVVPLNDDTEGSYGLASAGAERPQSPAPCRVAQSLGCFLP